MQHELHDSESSEYIGSEEPLFFDVDDDSQVHCTSGSLLYVLTGCISRMHMHMECDSGGGVVGSQMVGLNNV